MNSIRDDWDAVWEVINRKTNILIEYHEGTWDENGLNISRQCRMQVTSICAEIDIAIEEGQRRTMG